MGRTYSHVYWRLGGVTTFYVDPVKGNDTNPGSQVAPFKTFQTAVDRSVAPATIILLPGSHLSGAGINGPISGQKSPADLRIIGSGTTPRYDDCQILPPSGNACLTLAWGASCCLSGVLLNGSFNNGQDLVEVGAYSTLMIDRPMCFGPATSPGNHMTLAFGRAGLQVGSDYSIWFAGNRPQCHIDADDAWVYYNTNGQPGLITVTLIDNAGFTDSFIHCSNADVNIQAIGWAHQGGALYGTRTCIVEKCGVVDTGTSNDFANPPNPNALPGTKGPLVRGGGIYC